MLSRRTSLGALMVALLVVCTACPGGSARAEGRRIGVFVRTRYPALRGLAAQVQGHVRHWVHQQPNLHEAQLYATVHPEPTEAARQALRQADEALEVGRGAWLDGRLSDVLGPLSKAVELYSTNVAVLDSVAPLVEALQILGGLHLKEGQRKDAIRVFSRAMAFDPAATLDPERFAAETCSLYESGRAKAKATSGQLRVNSEPPGATVLVDGQPVGQTPLETSVAVVGRHTVRIVRDTFQPAGVSVIIRAGQPAEVELALEPIRQAPAFQDLIQRAIEEAGVQELMADQAISELGAALEVAELVLMRLVATTEEQILIEAYHYDFLDGQLINLGDRLLLPSSPELGPEVQRFTEDVLAARTDLSLGDSVPIAPPPEGTVYDDGPGTSGGGHDGGDSGGSILASPWLWVGLGGAAAAAGGVAAVVLLGGGDDPEPGGGPAAPSQGRVLLGFE